VLFNSYAFLLGFLPAAILSYRLADNYPSIRTWVLVVLSLIFYAYWDVRFLPLMVASILINWWAARLFIANRNPAVLTAAIIGNLLLLGIFKYTDFFLSNLATLAGFQVEPMGLLLPLGISFFTFHHIMYLVDLQRGRAPAYPLDRYALYICFFPQAISGPLARWNEVIHQFGQRVFQPDWERRFAIGIVLIVIGLFEKVVIADTLAGATDPIYSAALIGPVPDGRAWMSLAFAFQVFFDFAGYSDIAIGLALMFAITLPRNFDAPFRATSILEFWQRWHMTLARFLRDYVFYPLSNSRIGGREHRITRLLISLLLTMALCGLWHGAGWHFILWGILQGLALAFAATWRRWLPSPPLLIGWAATVSFFVLTIIVFRAENLQAAWHLYQGLTTLPAAWHPNGRNVLILAILCAVALPPSHEICEWVSRTPSRLVAASTAVALVLLLAVIGGGQNYHFIYFQF
jgi:alginate O-acetyltransferase complex protein AlgI